MKTALALLGMLIVCIVVVVILALVWLAIKIGYNINLEDDNISDDQPCDEVCCDNRFEVIAKAKEDLLNSTNIHTSEEEMKALDSFLFRCWQMGWLTKYDEGCEL